MTIRRGDILWADLGMFPTTSVQGGVRPVIVVSNNKANTYSSVITVVPLTSRIYKKRYLPTHVFISKYDMTGIRKGSLALAEQVMSISTKCIIEKCGRVNKWSLDRVLKAVRIQMGMEGEGHVWIFPVQLPVCRVTVAYYDPFKILQEFLADPVKRKPVYVLGIHDACRK